MSNIPLASTNCPYCAGYTDSAGFHHLYNCPTNGISKQDYAMLDLANNNNYISRDLDDLHKAYSELVAECDAIRKQLEVAKDLLVRLEIATNLRKSIYETPLHAFKAVHSEVIKALAEINRIGGMNVQR